MIVVDTNIIAYFIIYGPHTDQAKSIFQKDSDWVAPDLWRHEFLNVLGLTINHAGLPMSKALDYWEEAEDLMTDATFAVNTHRVLELSQTHKHPSYDCEFVALAEAFSVPLVTADKKLVAKFPKTAVIPSDYLNA